MVFCITGWIESEHIHQFINSDDNWTWTWSGAHILWHNTIIIIFENKIPLVNYSCKQKTGIPICLTHVVTILYSTRYKQLMLSLKCIVFEPVWRAKSYMYLLNDLVLLTALYMYIIFTLVDSEDIYDCIYTFHKTAIQRRVWILRQNDPTMIWILEQPAYWWYSRQFWVV